ncbi:hypothetical protein [Methylocystis parvus]|uniref:Sulfur globule protein n=1 Tax=Methylocystis parvus TaxID=134 RepID=A0A6B8MC45_9HYPH|nr:hypothetical protein [Methylocystis parvus]QGM99352.1 hypothetical protein F7D14_18945 [Methylocystis parvus]WBK00256.1 hypothetical protein MMG94_00590 [Methylocystis parvus OBBP]
MGLNLRHAITVAAMAGLLGASLASPAAAGDWGHGWGRSGWGYHGGWGNGGWSNGGWGNGGAAAAAALGGFALGAVAGAASQPAYGPGYGAYGDCYFVDRPVADDWGNVVAYRRAQVCE